MSIVIINGHQIDTQSLWFDNHGMSIFTTMRAQHGKPDLWPLHWQRLCRHAQHFGYHMPHEQEILETIGQHAPTPYAKVRVLIHQTSWALTVDAYEPPPASVYDGVAIIYSSMRPHPQLGAFKTTSYAPYRLAHQEALKHGVFEALMCDEAGHVVDGSRTSIVMFDGRTMTALLGGLEGCMRQSILNYSEQQGVLINRAYLRPQELHGQLILSNSLIGAVPVGPIRYPFLKRLVEHFRI